MDIETDHLIPDRVYVAVFGNNRGLYRSENRGDTWEKLWMDNYLRGVAVFPANPQIIYAVSSKPLNAGGYSDESNGVLKSLDGGQTWTPVNEGLSWPFASAVEIDPVRPDRVMIASPGEGCCARNFSTNGPVRSNLQPGGTLAPGTNSATISLTTDESATCKYSTLPNTGFDELQDIFSTAEGTNHSSLVTGLSDGNTYTFYCRCRDESGNTNTEDYQISFRIGEDDSFLPLSPVPSNFGIRADHMPSGGVNFSVMLDRPGGFMLRVFDLTGRLVWSCNKADAGPGVHNITWNGTEYPDNTPGGVYCVVLSASEPDRVTGLLFMK
jgi:hypothetical protein